MAMEILFENQTQLDASVINYIIEKGYKRSSKIKRYHLFTLLIGILAVIAAVYFGRLGLIYRDITTIICTAALAAVAVYAFYIYVKNTPKNQIKARQRSVSSELLKPRKIKVYKNVMYQSAGKSHGEYKLYQFTGIETWEHFFLLHYDNSYVVIDKNGFTTGTPEEFEKFMNERISKNC